jgi:chorismate-pyruvate lyase
MFGFGNRKGKALDCLRVSHPEEMALSDEEFRSLMPPYAELLTDRGYTLDFLEKRLQTQLKATVSQQKSKGGLLSRAIYLETNEGKGAAAGLSTINPEALPAEAKAELLEGKTPLGKLLQKYGVSHNRIMPGETATIRKYDSNWASAYLLGEGPHYGRTYTIFHAGRPVFIADIKEIFSNDLF